MAQSVPATIQSPVPGSALGSPITFFWSSGQGVTKYWLEIGNSAGATDIDYSGETTATSFRTALIPQDGRAVYVRLWSYIGNVWQGPLYYTYTAAGSFSGAVATITSPTPGSTLGGSNVTFTWTTAVGATKYWMDVGNSRGNGDIDFSGEITTTSFAAESIPTDGRTIYVRLWSFIGGTWRTPLYYSYTASGVSGGSIATLTGPTPGSTLPGNSATFTWSPGVNVLEYWFDVGNSFGNGDIASSYYTQLNSFKADNIPTDGRTIYVRLWSRFGSSDWRFIDYTFTAAGSYTGVPAQLTSHATGNVLPGSAVVFRWNTGTGVSKYWLDVGYTFGNGDLTYSGETTRTSFSASPIPTDGRTIYVRLWSFIQGAWRAPIYYTLTAATRSQGTTISPSELEVNLSAVPIDRYTMTGLNRESDSNSTPIVYGCPSTATVRSCFQNWFNPSIPGSWRAQGVTGVRFFFTLAGGHYSTPFLGNAAGNDVVNPAWAANLDLFLSDLKAAGIERITPTPVLDTWSGSAIPTEVIGATVCIGASETRNRYFVPWIPYALERFQFATGENSYFPDKSCGPLGNTSYFYSLQNPLFWGWDRLLNVMDTVMAKADLRELGIPALDYYQETNMSFTVQARMIYDNYRSRDVLQELRNRMQLHGFDPLRVAPSANFADAPYPGLSAYNCGSIYGDSAMLFTVSQLAGAISGPYGKIGDYDMDASSGLRCAQSTDAAYVATQSANMISLPVYHQQPTFIDVHMSRTYPALSDTANWAKSFFSSVWSFMGARGREDNHIMFGESNPVETTCGDGWTSAQAAAMLSGLAGQANGYKNSSLFVNRGARVAFRPWHRTEQNGACQQSPHSIVPPY